MDVSERLLRRFPGPAEDEPLSPSASTAIRHTHTGPCLLSLLYPVRSCLHPFLADKDAALLMRTSRSTIEAVLSGYAFVDHMFIDPSHSVGDVKRSLALHARYRTLIRRLSLPTVWNEPLVVRGSGLPLLPRSLVVLVLGMCAQPDEHRAAGTSAFEDSRSHWEQQHEREHSDEELITVNPSRWWNVSEYGSCYGCFDQPIPLGVLPHGLRVLQVSSNFNQRLQVGSIPDTVEVIQFGRAFNQRLAEGHLPASLTHLVFGFNYDQPLLPGVLPAGLQRLHLGSSFDQPLQLGTLPSQLRQLFLGWGHRQPIHPGHIPPSVTHLRFSHHFNQPLEAGCVPHGVVHLHLGDRFDQPLDLGVLPSSLRELFIGRRFTRGLQVGSLPGGLQVLAFHPLAVFQQVLIPGIIPTSVVAVSLSREYKAQLQPGGIPATVRWLRLPSRYASEALSAVLSPSTRVVWYIDGSSAPVAVH